jgi:hypothetical protein
MMSLLRSGEKKMFAPAGFFFRFLENPALTQPYRLQAYEERTTGG